MRRAIAFLPLLLALPLAGWMEARGRSDAADRSRAAVEEAADRFSVELQGRMERLGWAQNQVAIALGRASAPTEADWQTLVGRAGCRGLPGLRFVQVILRIAHRDRSAYETLLQSRAPGQRLWDLQGGRNGPLAFREAYYPVHYCDPPQPGLLGLDHASRLDSWSDIYSAEAKVGHPVLGGPFHSVLYPDRVAVLQAEPMGPMSGVRMQNQAFVTLVIDLRTLTEGLGAGSAWTLHDGALLHDATFLARGGEGPGPYVAQRNLYVANRVWTLRMAADADPGAAGALRHLRYLLWTAACAAALASALLWAGLGRG